jgi:glycine/D-amino acid oxidase-like deaminating enzyme
MTVAVDHAHVRHGAILARYRAAVKSDVVIVGGGLLGLCTAYALRGRREVIVLEADTVGHARCGSHGPSRVFRLGYADTYHVEMAQQSLEHWHRIEADTATQLLHPTRQLSFGSGADEVFAALTAAGAPVARLPAAEVARRYPVFDGNGDGVIVGAGTSGHAFKFGPLLGEHLAELVLAG